MKKYFSAITPTQQQLWDTDRLTSHLLGWGHRLSISRLFSPLLELGFFVQSAGLQRNVVYKQQAACRQGTF